MWASQTLCLVGSVVLSLFASTSFLALQIGVVLIGAGSAYLFPTGILWLKNVMPVTGKIGAVLTVAMNVSTQVNCLFIGYIIDDNPYLFVYLMTLTSTMVLILFTLTSLLVKHFRKGQKLKNDAEIS